MKKSELREIKKIITEGADWIILNSLPGNMAIDSFRGFIFNWKDLGGNEFEHGTKEWNKLYKKLNSKDKKIVDAVLKDIGL